MPKKVLCVKDDQEKWFDENKVPDGWILDCMVDAPDPVFEVPTGMKLVPVDSDKDQADEPEKAEEDDGSKENPDRNRGFADPHVSTFKDGSPADAGNNRTGKRKVGKL